MYEAKQEKRVKPVLKANYKHQLFMTANYVTRLLVILPPRRNHALEILHKQPPFG